MLAVLHTEGGYCFILKWTEGKFYYLWHVQGEGTNSECETCFGNEVFTIHSGEWIEFI